LKSPVTFLAVVSIVAILRHVRLRGGFREKRLGASFTPEARSPVIGTIHMLVASPLAIEGLSACLALGPVLVIIQVQLIGTFLVEFGIAMIALPHFGQDD
jgi:hypothetical protein